MSDSSEPTSKRRRRKSARVVVRRLLDLLTIGSDVRQRKVRRLRAAVRAKRYENALKLSIALDRMLENL